jgi:endonuclease/exonuclease/phosphatase family metal-dependent hydrolase
MSYKILFSNLGYARGINGSLWHHVSRIGRYFYSSIPAQEQSLGPFKDIIVREQPDLCCVVEIDRGSFNSAYYNQLQFLTDDDYKFHDIADKYGEGNPIGRLPLHQGKSNAFLAKKETIFEKLYFINGSKRLIYKIDLSGDIVLFFAHFSLNRKVRAAQFSEVNNLVKVAGKNVIILADFNIFQGFSELQPLLDGLDLVVLNDEAEPTFTFHKRKLALDLCICSRNLVSRAKLRVIPQPFSDHAALLVEV